MSRSRRKALGEDPLGKRGMRQNRYLMSKRRVSGEDPYAWVRGKEEIKKMERKPKPEKLARVAKRRKPSKLIVKQKAKRHKVPEKIWKELKRVEKGAVVLPQEIITAAKATGKATGRITADVSEKIASSVACSSREAKRIIRRVQSKIRVGPLRRRMRNLFGILGEECYEMIAKKKVISKGKKIQNIIDQIKNCQKALKRIQRSLV